MSGRPPPTLCGSASKTPLPSYRAEIASFFGNIIVDLGSAAGGAGSLAFVTRKAAHPAACSRHTFCRGNRPPHRKARDEIRATLKAGFSDWQRFADRSLVIEATAVRKGATEPRLRPKFRMQGSASPAYRTPIGSSLYSTKGVGDGPCTSAQSRSPQEHHLQDEGRRP